MKIPKRGMVQRGVNYNSSSKWSTKSQLLLLYTMWHKSRCSTLWLKAIVTHKSLQQKGFYHSTPIFKISCLYYKYDLYIRLLYTPMLLFSVSHHSHLARSRYKWSQCMTSEADWMFSSFSAKHQVWLATLHLFRDSDGAGGVFQLRVVADDGAALRAGQVWGSPTAGRLRGRPRQTTLQGRQGQVSSRVDIQGESEV